MSIPEVKIAFLGDVGVGKTSLFHRFMKDEFIYDASTSITNDIGRKDIQFSSKKVCFCFQDTKGFETLGSHIPTSLFRNVECVLFVYDLSDIDSLSTLKRWKDTFDAAQETYIPILVGNKYDLVGELSEGDILKRVKTSIQAEAAFQVSAKTGYGCEEILRYLVEKFYKRGRDALDQSVDLNAPQPVKSCCSL